MVIDKQDTSDEPTAVSSMVFRLDPRSGVPTYLQLVHQVEHALQLGYLTQGDQLPRVKDVVASLSINPNTVLKAYRDLEHKGLIAARPGQGTFVEVSPDTVGLAELTALRRSLVAGWLRDASAAGLDEDGIVALFTSAMRDFHDRPSELRAARGHTQGEGVA
jgi:GntR family transcriptional regulator